MHRASKRVLGFLVLTVFLILPSVTEADLSARFRVCSAQGTVTVQSTDDNTVCRLKREGNNTHCRVVTGSAWIKTGDRSYAEIEFRGAFSNGKWLSHHVHLGPNTTILVKGKVIFIKNGNTWFKVERQLIRIGPHRGRLNWGVIIKTPTAIAGIRGTEFLVKVSKTGDSRIRLIEGTIELSDINNYNSLLMNAGMEVLVKGNSSSLDPKPFHLAEREKWWTNWPTLVPVSEKPGYVDEPDMKIGTEKPAVADAYVYAYNYQNWNRSNFGKYDQLVAGRHPTGGESRAYIKFDLSGTDASKVNKAILKLYHFQTSGNDGVELGIYHVTSPWNEGTDTYHSGRTEKTAPPGDISWVQQPMVDPIPVATFNPGMGIRDWTEVDITALVKQWLSGTPNFGLVIQPIGHLGRNIGVSTYHFASRERDPNLGKLKGISKTPTLVLSENTSVNNGATQPPHQPTNSGSTQNTFSCVNNDNEEKGCCCFQGAHTYRFASRYVTNVLVRFDTGKRFNCLSTVSLDIDRGNGWKTVKTIQANSSKGGSERAPIEVGVSVNDTIKGFRIADGCVCCIDSSEITLNTAY